MRFAVHRPGIPEASPRSHGVPRRDIPGRVYVSIAGKPAGRACESRLALARLRIHMPAQRALLASESRFYLLYPAGRLLDQSADQKAPTGPQDLAVQPSLGVNAPARIPSRTLCRSRHVPDLEIFDTDHVEAARNVSAGLLGPVPASVCLSRTQLSDGPPHPRSAVRAAPSPGEPMLQPLQARLLPYAQARDAQQIARRQSCGYNDASVNAHDLAIARRRNRLGDYSEGDMPSSCGVHFHSVRLGARRYRAGPAEPHPPGLRHPHLSGLTAESAYMPRLHGNDPESLVPPSLAPRWTSDRILRIEECSLRLGEVPQRLLLHHLGACGQPFVLGADSSKLPTLFQITWSACAAQVPVRVLLDGQVPHVPGIGTVILQDNLLGGCWKQPVPGHANTLATSTDISRAKR